VALSPSVWATEDMLANKGGDNKSDTDRYSAGASDTGARPSHRRQQRVIQEQGGTNEAWQLRSGTHWTSPRMSRILKRNSLVGCQHGFTISSWRHLSAAIAQRYFQTAITRQASFANQINEGYSSASGEEDTDDNSP
jgi:hypothetical protein